MAGLNTGEIVSITFMGRLFGQRVMNVLHYRVTASSTDPTYEGAAYKLAAAMQVGTASPGLSMLAAQGPEYRLESIRCQLVHPVRERYVEYPVNNSGTNAGNCTSPNVSAVIIKKAAAITRHGLGTFHLPGIPETGYVAGALTGAYTTLMTTIAAKLLNDVTPVLEVLTVQPVLWTPADGIVYFPLVTAYVIPTLRIMRRRTVGLGI